MSIQENILLFIILFQIQHGTVGPMTFKPFVRIAAAASQGTIFAQVFDLQHELALLLELQYWSDCQSRFSP
jgi:hypothetical protein